MDPCASMDTRASPQRGTAGWGSLRAGNQLLLHLAEQMKSIRVDGEVGCPAELPAAVESRLWIGRTPWAALDDEKPTAQPKIEISPTCAEPGDYDLILARLSGC